MLSVIKRFFKKRFGRRYGDINPEDIFMDSTNLPGFSEHRLEGRIERPMDRNTFIGIRIALALIIVFLASKLWILEIKEGKVYAEISEKNRLEHTLIFANRGVIYDRNMLLLATNATRENESSFAGRIYAPYEGLSHAVGYLKYPATDSKGFFYDLEYHGRDGAEKSYDEMLAGENGIKLRETDVHGNVTSESVIDYPEDGEPVVLSLDARVTEELYRSIKNLAQRGGYEGGAGVIMDIETGELLALTSYPSYDQNLMTKGEDKREIARLLNHPSKPFLNRAVGGLYTPGSIVKPILALAALNEGLISPDKQILSTGELVVPNPYDPSKPSVFGDWKAHGWTDMREALAVSSDVYFYTIGGGFGSQRGLGISTIDRYFNLFGIADKTGIELGGELDGVIPTPEWKKERFNGDPWRLGDTYITSIGQYGTLVTPLSAARFTATLANGGKILTPSIIAGGQEDPVERTIDLDPTDLKIVREGMRQSVTDGTSALANVPYVKVAAKTGTAELGAAKRYVNSWSVGFFPYDNPRYAYAVLVERGPVNNGLGATGAVRELLDWMSVNSPQYLAN